MRGLDELLDEGRSTLERLLNEAFLAGVELGKKEASTHFQQRLATLFESDTTVISQTNPAITMLRPESDIPKPVIPNSISVQPRSNPGTVKPELIRLIEESGDHGLSYKAMENVTGFKPSSIRGTLSMLYADKTITKINDLWVSAKYADALKVKSALD